MAAVESPQIFYENFLETWDRIRAHVFSHFVLFFLLFVVVGVAVPSITYSQFNPELIVNNSWYHLVKETDLLFLVPVLFLLAIVIYGLLIYNLGKFLVKALRFQTNIPFDDFINTMTKHGYEQIAYTIAKNDFSLNDLLTTQTNLALEFQSVRKQEYDLYTKAIIRRTKNASIYLGNFYTFLLIWIALFFFLPKDAKWITHNQQHFWLVALLLFFVVILCRMNQNRILRLSNFYFVETLGRLLKRDPDYKKIINDNQERRNEILARIDELIEMYSTPSLIRHFIKTPAIRFFRTRKLSKGYPFHGLYCKGKAFEKVGYKTEGSWALNYFAYQYYRFYEIAQAKGRRRLIMYGIIGIDELIDKVTAEKAPEQ